MTMSEGANTALGSVTSQASTIIFIIVGLIVLYIAYVLIMLPKVIKRLGSVLKGLTSDAIDAIISFLDYFPAGEGAVGLDWGDWIAAPIIYMRERKVVGDFFAFLVAWEATNFIPFSFIPIVGEVIEFITNFTPSALFARSTIGIHNFEKAAGMCERLEKNIRMSGAYGIDFSSEQETLNKMRTMLASENPIGAIKECDKSGALKSIEDKLGSLIEGQFSEVDSMLQSLVEQNVQGTPEMMAILQERIDYADELLAKAKEFMDNKEFDKAVTSINDSRNTINQGIEEFNAQAD